MQKIVKGKKYDTETASFIGNDSHSNPTDFHFWEESLYKTKKGSYFLHGEGGAATKYAMRAGQNSYCGGEDIIPLSRDDAYEWAEKHLSTEEIEDEFSDFIEEA